MSIRSPLAALGALMVLLQGIAAAALIPVSSQPELQRVLVWMMVAVTSVIAGVVTVVVLWFTFKNPGLPFNPKDISPEAHLDLYGSSSRVPRTRKPISRGEVTFEVSREEPANP